MDNKEGDRKNFMDIPLTSLRDERHIQHWQKALIIGIAVSFLLFMPYIIYDKGIFLYYGDFNVQQIPFYQLAHQAIKSGNTSWSIYTDLGANFIGSYSFYLLGSPFFWLTIPFPNEFVPYLMGPLLILKFGSATLAAYIYLNRYTRNKNYAILGAILYAFSGFSIYNIFFNHFHEPMITFPLLLWALDEYMLHKRRLIFSIAVFASCLVNYYFFVGQVVFLIIYWFIRVYSGSYRITLKQFAWLILESILGVLLSSGLLIPAVLATMQNPRINNPAYGFDAILYHESQKYLHILQSLFFPPDLPARINFTPDSDAKWASLGAYLPMFGMCGVIGFFGIKGRNSNNWLKHLLKFLLLMAMVPLLNSAFQLFNQSFYTRWFYMLTLMTALATISALECEFTNWERAIKRTLAITLAIAIPIAILPKRTKIGPDSTIKYGLMEYPDRFYIYVAIALLGMLVFFALLRYRQERGFIGMTITATCTLALVSSLYIVGIGKQQSYNTHNFIIPCCINAGDKITLPERKNCRTDILNGMDNLAMFWKLPSIQAFHSLVPGSVMKFYPTIGVERNVASRPSSSVYGLRGLTSCRWLIDPNNKYKASDTPPMTGFEYYGHQNGSTVWENKFYIPYGFSYDSYITDSQYKGLAENLRHLVLLKSIVLSDEQAEKYGYTMTHQEHVMDFEYTPEQYQTDCAKRRESSCLGFEYDNIGFSATTANNTNQEKLVFFSVPFDSGWSASVNGKPAKIEEVNVGFMAVSVPENSESSIRFNYRAPGLLEGVVISICAEAILLCMWLFFRHPKK